MIDLQKHQLRRALFHWDEERTIHPTLLAYSEWKPTQVAEGIHTFPLLSPDFCKAVIWLGDLLDHWEPDPQDPYPGREFASELVIPFHRVVETIFDVWVRHAVRSAFDFPVKRVARSFVLRYSMDTQRAMGLHHDDQSDVSMSVVLNRDWTGPGLRFPRQGWDSELVPVGHAVIFPGKVTHPHEARPLESGTRYSWTWWLKGAEAP